MTRRRLPASFLGTAKRVKQESTRDDVPATPRPAARSSRLGDVGGSRKKAPPSSDLIYRREARTPSTSPPPQPIPEQHMIEGMDNDDQYRMVEDEFFVMAGQFTAHLHRAEYDRLKKQASSQNADTIASISRPVVGPLTEVARRRQEDVLRQKKQRDALSEARARAGVQDDSGDEGDAPWRGTALQGLMDKAQKEEMPLTRLIRAEPTARSAPNQRLHSALASGSTGPRPVRSHGQKRSLMEADTESEDDGDLGAGFFNRAAPAASFRQAPAPSPRPLTVHQTPTVNTTQEKLPAHASLSAPRMKAASSISAPAKSFSSPAAKDGTDSEDSDPFESFRGKRRKEKERRRQVQKEAQDQKGKGHDIIPTFLL